MKKSLDRPDTQDVQVDLDACTASVAFSGPDPQALVDAVWKGAHKRAAVISQGLEAEVSPWEMLHQGESLSCANEKEQYIAHRQGGQELFDENKHGAEHEGQKGSLESSEQQDHNPREEK